MKNKAFVTIIALLDMNNSNLTGTWFPSFLLSKIKDFLGAFLKDCKGLFVLSFSPFSFKEVTHALLNIYRIQFKSQKILIH